MPLDAALADLESKLGHEVHVSDWVTVDQERIDRFAKATGDYQWIHVDVERAATSPFGGTIAHGFLTLSLISDLTGPSLPESGPYDDATMRINYGLDKVRFPTPVPAGSRLRARTEISAATRVGDSAIAVVRTVTVELEGATKPACVAQSIARINF